MTNWAELIVTDSEGEVAGSLGDIVENSPANLDAAKIVDGKIAEWPYYFLSADGEEADYNTPRGPVDWNGFTERLSSATA